MLHPKRKPSTVGRRGLRNEIGARGETLAADFLVKEGYEIIARNLQYACGEIDILARKGEEVVIVEVKTRSAKSTCFDPGHAIAAKRKTMMKLGIIAAASYPEYSIRFDYIFFETAGRIEWIQGIF